MKIFLRLLKTVALDANSSDTIDDIKAKLCKMEGTGMNQQILFFAGHHLSDTTRTLADYSIPENATINVHIGDGMRISIKIPSGKTIMLYMDSWDTIKRVKAMIQDKEGILPEQQALFYLGRTLEDQHMLKTYNIREDSVVQLVLRPIVVDDLHVSVILSCGRTIGLQVKTWFTVKDVKIMIESIDGIPAGQQRLVYDGKNLEDGLTLSACKLIDKSVLQLQVQMQIFVKPWNENTVILLVNHNDTIEVVMEKIRKKLGYALENHYLAYAGKFLGLDRTLGDYNIQNESTIHIQVQVSGFVGPEDEKIIQCHNSQVQKIRRLCYARTKKRMRRGLVE